MDIELTRRKAQRLPHFDYSSAGAYFVTVCTQNRLPAFGKVVNENIELSAVGEIVSDVWHSLPNHYAAIELDEFVLMPNHVHGIVWILGEDPLIGSVGEGLRPSPTKTINKHGLPEIIRAFKSFSARGVNKSCNTSGKPLWQRGYHEHIIRNDEDLYQHLAYIVNNPLKWVADEYYQ